MGSELDQSYVSWLHPASRIRFLVDFGEKSLELTWLQNGANVPRIEFCLFHIILYLKEEMVMLCIYFYIKIWFDCCQKLTLPKAKKNLKGTKL